MIFGEGFQVKSSTSLLHSKENVSASHTLQTNNETIPICIKDPQFKIIRML